MNNLKYILRVIKKRYQYGVPNGVLLKWDRNRFKSNIQKVIGKNYVLEQHTTDFDYEFCNSYSIKIDINLYIYCLNLNISFIGDFYEINWSSMKKRTKQIKHSIRINNFELINIENIIDNFFKKRGFIKISDDIYNIKIEGIELELSELDEVTIGKCLFNDSY